MFNAHSGTMDRFFVFERSKIAVTLYALTSNVCSYSIGRPLIQHTQRIAMRHQKLSRSKCARSAMIPAAFLCVVVSGCADQQPTGPELPFLRVERDYNVPFNKFFVAWSQSYSSGPIQKQLFSLDTRQNRQYGGFIAYQSVLSFARANPGRLYINGDEPDQYCITPYDYADIYHDFVTAVRGADPTARVSPAGFAEPNYYCCPPPGEEPCRSNMHSMPISFTMRMYSVSEWRHPLANGGSTISGCRSLREI